MALNINIEEYMKRFRIFHPKTLLEPDFKMLKQNRCPLCFRKLYWRSDGKMAFCKSKVKDKFFIRKDKFDIMVNYVL